MQTDGGLFVNKFFAKSWAAAGITFLNETIIISFEHLVECTVLLEGLEGKTNLPSWK